VRLAVPRAHDTVAATLVAELRASMRVQSLSLRVGTVLLLCFPLSAAIGALLHRLGVYPGWIQALVEHRDALLFLAMLFSMVAFCDSIIRHRTQWQFLAEIGVAIALGYLTSRLV
jgi:hypothetical protein